MNHKEFLAYRLIQWPRILVYRFLLSTYTGYLSGNTSTANQPILLQGKGNIELGKTVKFGYQKSPGFYSGYTYLEARDKESLIKIGNNVHLNNNCSLISVRDSIKIGNNCVFGVCCSIIDNDFHPVTKKEIAKGAPVSIGNHVFIGSHVQILKGVHIADGCIIANSSVVTKSFKTPCVIAGNPAKKVRDIDFN